MSILSTTTWGVPQPLLIGLAILIVLIDLIAIVDVARRPAPAFEQAGQRKTTWLLILILTAIMCGPVGAVVAIYYLVSVRPKVQAA